MNLFRTATLAAGLYIASTLAFSQDIPNDIARRISEQRPLQYIVEKDYTVDSSRIQSEFKYTDFASKGIFEDDVVDIEYDSNINNIWFGGSFRIDNSGQHIDEQISNKKSEEKRKLSHPIFMDELLRQVMKDSIDDKVLLERVRENINSYDGVTNTDTSYVTWSSHDMSIANNIKKHWTRLEYLYMPDDTGHNNGSVILTLRYFMLKNDERYLLTTINYDFNYDSFNLEYKRNLSSGHLVDIGASASVSAGSFSGEIKDMNFIERFLSSGFSSLADGLDDAIDKDLAKNSSSENLKVYLKDFYLRVYPILALAEKGELTFLKLLKVLK